MNQAAREAREAEYKEFLILIFFPKNEFYRISKKLDNAWKEIYLKKKRMKNLKKEL